MTKQAVRQTSYEIYSVDSGGKEVILKSFKYLDDANRYRDVASKRLLERGLHVYFREVKIDHSKEIDGWYFSD